MKKTLAIIGISLIAGAVVYVLRNRSRQAHDDTLVDATDISSDSSAFIINPDNIHSANAEFCSNKASTISDMSSRHEEASKIMKDAVEIICERSKVSRDTTEDLEQISDELDKLLSEV